jgi:hypothetical protein
MKAYDKYTPIIADMLCWLMARLRIAGVKLFFVCNLKNRLPKEQRILYWWDLIENKFKLARNFLVINYFIRRIHAALFNYNSILYHLFIKYHHLFLLLTLGVSVVSFFLLLQLTELLISQESYVRTPPAFIIITELILIENN